MAPCEGGIWVLMEPAGDKLRSVGLELLGKARQLRDSRPEAGGLVTAVLFSKNPEIWRTDLQQAGAECLLEIADAGLEAPEEMRYTDQLAALMEKYRPEIALFGATAFGRSLAPRLAARLGAGLTADCTALSLDPENGGLMQTRPAFGGNLMAMIVSQTRPQLATVRPRVFPLREFPGANLKIVSEAPASAPSPIRILQSILREDGANIADADILVALGQGACSPECVSLAMNLAERLGGAVAASRPVVDAGILPYAHQVGQTGKAVAPRLYLAIGVSGAMQHMAGVAAERLIAVNADPDAPIFQFAQWGVVGDGAQFLREAVECLRR